MNISIEGITIITICSYLYYLSYKRIKLKCFERALSFIIIAGLILRVFTSFDFFLHDWDEKYHALVAKNLLTSIDVPRLYLTPLLEYNYQNWTGNHFWLHKQPLPLYVISGSMYFFGENVIALRIPSITLGTITIYVIYQLGKLLFSKKIGVLASFLYSINGLIIELTAGRVATDHYDIFFTSLIFSSLLFLLRSVKNQSSFYFALGGALVGLAILTKWLPALIVLPLWWIYSWKNKVSLNRILIRTLVLIIIITVISLPWQIYIHNHYPLEAAYESEFNMRHLYEALEGHGHPFYFHINRMRIIFGELVYLPLIWLLYSWFKKPVINNKFILLCWIMISYIFFSAVATKMQGYILICAPAIFIMIAAFFFEIQNSQWQIKAPLITKLISVLLIALPIRYALERIKPFEKRRTEVEWTKQIRLENDRIQNPKKVIFNTCEPIKVMFYSDLIAYSNIPSEEKLCELQKENYSILVDDCSLVPANIQNLDFIEFRSLSHK